MKKKLVLILIVFFTFSLLFIACNNSGGGGGGGGSKPLVTNTTLDGTWVGEDGEELDFNNGTLIVSAEGLKVLRATYTTSGNKITVTAKDIHRDVLNEARNEGGEDAKQFGYTPTTYTNEWYSISSLLNTNKALIDGLIEADLLSRQDYNEAQKMLNPQTATYSITGDILIITGKIIGTYDGDAINEDFISTYIRK